MSGQEWVIRNCQRLLADVGYYDGPENGIVGPKTERAAAIVEKNLGVSWAAWPPERRVIAAAQRILTVQGFAPGSIDGLAGMNTKEAMKSWLGRTRPEGVERAPEPSKSSGFPTQGNITSYYGQPGGPDCTAGTVNLPIPFVLAWDPSRQVRSFKAHKLIAPTFQEVFEKAVAAYGEREYRRLRLDRFGGCFNDRNMRGGTKKSMHAWGIAVDLDPENNQLRWDHTRATFARPEYEAFWKIVESKGLVSLGRVRDFDWMHFQGARL